MDFSVSLNTANGIKFLPQRYLEKKNDHIRGSIIYKPPNYKEYFHIVWLQKENMLWFLWPNLMINYQLIVHTSFYF